MTQCTDLRDATDYPAVEVAWLGEALGELAEPIGRRAPVDLPCQVHDPELWFAERPADLELAKALCADCPVRSGCFEGALQRREAAGVWGGQIFQDGRVIPFKRGRGRPRKDGSLLPPSFDIGARHASVHYPASRNRTNQRAAR